MPEEAHADALAFVRALDDAGDIGHHEGTVVVVAHDAQVGLQRGEGVIGYLGLGRCDGGEEGALPGVGEAYEAHIGQHFQLQDEPAFHAFLSGLGVAGCLVGGGLEVVVAPAAAAALTQDVLLPGLHELGDDFFGLGIFDHYALGHFQHDVGAVLAPFEGLGTVAAVLGPHHFAVAQVDEGPQLGIYAQDDVAAPAAVTAVGTALGDVFGPVEVSASGAAVTAGAEDAYVVYEVTFCHNLFS